MRCWVKITAHSFCLMIAEVQSSDQGSVQKAQLSQSSSTDAGVPDGAAGIPAGEWSSTMGNTVLDAYLLMRQVITIRLWPELQTSKKLDWKLR